MMKWLLGIAIYLILVIFILLFNRGAHKNDDK
ncbi:hypothetical protein C5L23_001329 [Leuconostoc fallax]|uniref:Uncharacterized protein n=1 Tax=Leuconostoc fallax TaxID=1251 RepID=A0A4V3A294_9LACO|nr:hypothetical protein C5L23_001329 [Leuconostoc fallax]